MLTANDVYDLAEQHEMRVNSRWSTDFTSGREKPVLVQIMVFFMDQKPEVWKKLMTNLCEVPVIVNGTRQVSGSGAIDGTFYPCYRALLPEVNALRKELGLDPIRN